MADEPEWPVLAALGPHQRDALLATCGRPRHFSAGRRLMHHDAPPRGLFLLRAGHVAVVVSADAGREHIVNILGPGSCIGEIALLDGSTRSASIEALDDCEAYFLGQADFERFRQDHRELDDGLLRVLAKQVRDLTDNLADTNRPARVRVIRRLLQTAIAYGAAHPDGTVPISHATLATVTGIGETTVQSELSRLQDLGLIRQERRRITLLDLDALSDIADDGGGGVIG